MNMAGYTSSWQSVAGAAEECHFKFPFFLSLPYLNSIVDFRDASASVIVCGISSPATESMEF